MLTVSDRVSRGEAEDRSGDLLAELLAADGYDVERRVVPDDRSQVAEALWGLTDIADLVLTTGGTGFAPRDVTPEATAEVVGDGVVITASAETTAQTGVEMEALTAALAAALTVYDMTKGLDPSIEIVSAHLLEKDGGKSGHWRRPA